MRSSLCVLLSSLVLASSFQTSFVSSSPSFRKTPVRASVSETENTAEVLEQFFLQVNTPSSDRRMFLGSLVATSLAVTGGLSTAPKSASSATSNTHTEASGASIPPIDWSAIFQKASKKALGGGKAGASAAVVQVCSLMWLRTSMNYQYRYGGNLQSSLSTLWSQGGISRLYQGLPFALVQGPLTRFGDTAANVGMLALLAAATPDWPIPLQTFCGSVAAGTWRIFLMPIDASKTAMQVEGAEGLQTLWSNAFTRPWVLYQGALAQAAATAVGHFPWFLTYNALDAQLPVAASDELLLSLGRSALLGFSASCVSDCSSNSLRVIKTTKQTAQLNKTEAGSDKDLSYPEVIKMIVEDNGVAGLFGRGLQTRLLTNAIQGSAFSILWKYFQQVNGV